MTTFASTRPSPVATVVGPPGAVTGAASAGASIIVIENPPNGLLGAEPFVSSLASFMASIVPRERYSLGVSRPGSRQRVDRRHDLARQELHRGRVDDVGDAQDHVLRAGIGQFAEPVHELARCLGPRAAIGPQAGRLERRALDLV